MKRLRGVVIAVVFAVSSVTAFTPCALAQPRTSPERLARAQALFGEGQRAYEAGDLNTALAKMLEANRLVQIPDLTFNLARVYERMGDAPNAVRHFRAYLTAAQPAEAVRVDVQRRIAAMEALARRQREQIFATPPTGDELTNEARSFFLRGAAFFRRRQYQPALEAFEAANTFARLPEVQYNLGVIRERLGETSDAILHYEEYLRMRPDSPDAALVRTKIQTLRARRGR